MYISFIILILLNFSKCHGLDRLNLGGFWRLNGTNQEHKILNATVPGGIFSDLLLNKIIEDPLYDENDQKYKWVGESDWIYYRNFTVPESMLGYNNINIIFEGLDTIASIYLNGIHIGNTSNMFVRYIFDVKHVLSLGTNQIEILFTSPVQMGKKLANDSLYPIPPQCPPNDYRGECHVNQLRKMQASFSWDWGPAIASMGIWKDVYLEGSNSSVIRYVVVELIEDSANDLWNVKSKTYLSKTSGTKADDTKIIYRIEADFHTNLIFVEDVNGTIFDLDEPVIENTVQVSKNVVKRWWPNGYGEQNMYNFNVSIISPGGNDTFIQRIGFRTVELVQEEIKGSKQEKWGNTFYFKVNGIPIFAKGSNYIPSSILPEKGQDKKLIDSILQTARDSNMNMLRVWGGGIYESDYFYQRTDELGIMVWQDFMFACALYPTREEFLENVRSEVNHQVKRIASHPSIVLWAGNNENEAAITGNWYRSNGKQIYNDDYKKLYKQTIRTEFQKLLEGGIFLLSSPSNGIKTDEDGGISKNPYDLRYGDDHTYIYALDGFNPNIYPIPRFSSEYGFQSYPAYSSLKKSTSNESNLVIGSSFLEGRQHHPLGDLEMTLLISYQFQLPPRNNANYTRVFIYYSQVYQAAAIKTETEHYRKYRSILNLDGTGLTMGALYWQLNDVWLAPTWSGMDVTGKWKILQYLIRDAFAPLITVGQLTPYGSLDLTIVSDKTVLTDATLSVEVFKWNSFTPIAKIEKNVSMEATSSKTVMSMQTSEYLTELGCGQLSNAANNCFFTLNLLNGTTKLAPENFVFPKPLHDSNLQTPKIKITSVTTISSDKERRFKIVLKTSQIALFIWLECGEVTGKFSENGFHQITSTKTIYFETDGDISSEELRKTIAISNILSVSEMY